MIKSKNFMSQKNRPALVRYGVVVIVLILWYSFIWDPVNARLEEKRTAYEAQQLKIVHLKKRINRLKNADKILASELKRLDSLKKRLVPGETTQQVSTNIQNSFLKKASDAGVEVVVYRSGSRRKWRGYPLAVSVFNIKGTTAQFVDLLEKLGAEKKLYRLNNINISKLRGNTSQLRINLEVEALFPGDKAEI